MSDVASLETIGGGDTLDPLDFYQNVLKDRHAQTVSDAFEELLETSVVDEQENQALIRELRGLEKQANSAGRKCFWWKVALGIVALLCAGGTAYLYSLSDLCKQVEAISAHWMIAPPAIGLPLLFFLWQAYQKALSFLNDLKAQCDVKRKEAWKQVRPLNRLFEWDLALKLAEKSFPALTCDSYFHNGRLREMVEQFNFSQNLGNNTSILHTHSGALNGNPFILAQTLNHWMGTKLYTGTLSISWTERHRDSNGNWVSTTRHQVLTASVTKPFPEYGEETFLIYANEAAPDLTFSRSPSKLSGLGDGFFDKMRKNHAVKKLEKKSLKGDNNFTVMANREFESLFGASNRTNEVQFRLLFTPLAQQQMLRLLKDSEIGCGDDFSFSKDHMINWVRTAHLRATDIDGSPKKFQSYEIAEMREFFKTYHAQFLHSFYFALAPLWAIPLYQNHRSHQEIYKDTYAKQPCAWEHEAVANDYGERAFAHPESKTRNLLKTALPQAGEAGQKMQVTATGYKSVARVTFIPVFGGDGKFHQVPVPWDEYFSVAKNSEFEIGAFEDVPEGAALEKKGLLKRGPLFATKPV
ncbi:hypothetical protein FAI40_03730 [Acetobacteraceae bacterium]|nr:hypothetical protein FAI40_03730 [Acetobacteraceae bacterium]